MRQCYVAVCAAFAIVSLVLVAHAQGPAVSSAGRAGRRTYQVPRTPWGDPDLEGKWPGSLASGIPLQRAESLGTRDTLNDAEFADRVAQAERQKDQDVAGFDFDHPSVPFGVVGGGQSPPQHWFERSAPQRQASLIVDPPNGRLPAMTPAAQQRIAQRRARENGDSASYTDFTLTERCITRGLTGSVLPGGYNNGNQIVQSPGFVTFVNEMIHESRIVPLDGRPHPGPAIRTYLGDSRGQWDGDTLVIETTNFLDRAGVGMSGAGASDALQITERLTRTSATTLDYSLTVSDPVTWTAPFTIRFDLGRDDRYGMFEYACHEGNYALQNIMSGQRFEERSR
ncbi:MAG: hypothetical protein ABI868_00880 [Acidobacteriota bacterium]